MHTVSQARELWCPMTRIARREAKSVDCKEIDENLVVIASCNRDALGGGNGGPSSSDRHAPLASCRCIADKCAMWRWAPSSTTHMERRIVPRIQSEGFCEINVAVPDAPTHGYCGLAGKSEVLS